MGYNLNKQNKRMGISRNLESNIKKRNKEKYMNIVKSTIFPKTQIYR